ncbi:MAG: hypothetical protein IPL37_01720 [Austwickia sp.]|jgi:hypothetical protein|nr:hypothetical protein [Austwickia sp.]
MDPDTDAATETAQNVVDSVSSWHHGSEEEHVKEALSEGLDGAGVKVSSDDVQQLARDIKESEGEGAPDVSEGIATPADE